MMSYDRCRRTTVCRITTLFILNQSLHWFTIGLVIPVLSLFVLAKGMGYFELGLLMAAYSGVTVILELPTGGLADSLGRKRVYLAALGASALGALVLLCAGSFVALACGFGLLGLGRALSSGTMEAHFIDALLLADPRADLQKASARLGVATPLALGIASLVGGFLPFLGARFLPKTGPLNAYSLNYLAYLLALTAQGALTYFLVHEERGAQSHAVGLLRELREGFAAFPRVLKESIALGLRNRVILLILVGGFVWGFAVVSLEQLWQPRVIELGGEAGKALLGPLSAGYFAAAAIGSLLSTGFCGLFQRRYDLALGGARLLMGGIFLLLAGASGLPAFASFYFLGFAANGLSSSPESAVLNAATPTARRSTTLSLASLFSQAGGLAGSVVFGALAQARSIGFSWSLAALALAASSGLYFALPRGANLGRGCAT